MAVKAAILALLAGAAWGQVIQPINPSDLVKNAPAKLNWNYQLLYNNVWTQADTGAADAYVAGLNPNPLSLGAIGPFYLLISNTNQTTTPTLNVNFLGAKVIKHRNGSPLGVAGLVAGGVYPFRYVTSCDCFQTEDDETGGGGGGGTVTTVTFTGDGVVLDGTPTPPVTIAGTLAPVLAFHVRNVVLAGPTSGSAASPTFRGLVAADIPAIDLTSKVTGLLPKASGGTGTATPGLIAGAGISITNLWPNQTITSTSTASVSSVSFTGDGVVLDSTPTAPITTSGSLHATLAFHVANVVFAGPSTGSAASPTFRALVAADIPALAYQTPLTLFGSGTGVPTTSALGVVGNCVQWSTLGLGDAGIPCGGGGGGGGANALGFYFVNQATNAPANAINLGTLSTGIAKLTGTGSVATISTVLAPTGTIVGTSDTQALTNKTLDGVSPATMAFLDPTSSVQTQLNAKQATITTGTTAQYFKGDLSLGTTPTITGSSVLKGSSGNAVAAGFADVVLLFGGGTCSGFIKSDGTCVASSATAWSGIGAPSGNLALTMAANTSTFTFNATTGANDLVKYTDTSSNTGTGALVHLTTASGSAATPWQADANGCGWKVNTTGALASTGCASNTSTIMSGTSGNTDMAGRVTLVATAGTYTFINTYVSAPVCMAQDETDATKVVSAAVTTTTITFGGTGTDVVRYICVGLN